VVVLAKKGNRGGKVLLAVVVMIVVSPPKGLNIFGNILVMNFFFEIPPP